MPGWFVLKYVLPCNLPTMQDWCTHQSSMQTHTIIISSPYSCISNYGEVTRTDGLGMRCSPGYWLRLTIWRLCCPKGNAPPAQVELDSETLTIGQLFAQLHIIYLLVYCTVISCRTIDRWCVPCGRVRIELRASLHLSSTRRNSQYRWEKTGCDRVCERLVGVRDVVVWMNSFC